MKYWMRGSIVMVSIPEWLLHASTIAAAVAASESFHLTYRAIHLGDRIKRIFHAAKTVGYLAITILLVRCW